MASTASALSWTSSSLLQSFTGNINQATKISDRGTALVIIAQKKAKKARTVMLTNGFPFITWCFYSYHLYGYWDNCKWSLLRVHKWKNPPQYVPHSVQLLICLLLLGLDQIILKEDVVDLGKQGQLVSVKAGYYRNYLLPTGKAQIVTPLLLK